MIFPVQEYQCGGLGYCTLCVKAAAAPQEGKSQLTYWARGMNPQIRHVYVWRDFCHEISPCFLSPPALPSPPGQRK